MIRQLVAVARECAKSGDVEKGKSLHLDAIEAGCDRDKYVAAALINMYRKCGSMKLAQRVFDKMTHRNVVVWTSLILGYAEKGEIYTALDVFQCMDCEPDSVSLLAALQACSLLASKLDRLFCFEKGMEIHRKLAAQTDAFVDNRLVDLYSNFGSLLHAKAVFNSMACRDVVSWNSLILGFAKNGHNHVALEFYHNMDQDPDSVTFVAVFKALIGLVSEEELERVFCFEKGTSIHVRAKLLGCDTDVFVADTLLEFYSKCNTMLHARAVFDNLRERNIFLWTSLILGYVENSKSLVALDVWKSLTCKPDSVSFVAGVKACSGVAAEGEFCKLFCLEEGISIHKKAKLRGVHRDLKVASTLLDMYCRCEALHHARALFNSMEAHDAVSWNSLVLGHVTNDESLVAMEFFLCMDVQPSSATFIAALQACSGMFTNKQLDRRFCLEEGMKIHKQAKELQLDTNNNFLENALLDFYSRCRSMSHAQAIFDSLVYKDVVSWNTLILGYTQTGEQLAALELFTSMDCEPNHFTLVVALKACGSAGAVGTGERIHSLIRKLGVEQSLPVANGLVEFYGKCGRMAAAEQVFEHMFTRNVASWNNLLAGYSLAGHVAKMVELVKRMQETGSEMNEVSLLLVLSACSHAGLMEEGRRCFETMTTSCNVSPGMEHYSCLVDMLGRADSLQEALAVVHHMPFECDSVVWRTLLGSCRSWKHSEASRVASDAFKYFVPQTKQSILLY